MLYIWMISLIFYRYTFFQFMAGDLTPPAWTATFIGLLRSLLRRGERPT